MSIQPDSLKRMNPASAKAALHAGVFLLAAALGAAAQIPAGLTPPRPIAQPDPLYSEPAKIAAVQTTIAVETHITARGTVDSAEVVNSSPDPVLHSLEILAVESVRQWRFHPAKLQGVPTAVSTLVIIRFHMWGFTTMNPMQAQKGCLARHAAACFEAGIFAAARMPDAPDALEEALADFDTACSGGDARACMRLGYLYGAGAGVAPDPARSAGYYQKACDEKQGYGCEMLADLVKPTDPQRAADLMRRGCKEGDHDACASRNQRKGGDKN